MVGAQSWSTELPQTRDISTQHHFFIEKVIDKRGQGSFVQLDPGARVILDFFDRSMTETDRLNGVALFVRALDVKGGDLLEVRVDFYYQGQFVHEGAAAVAVGSRLQLGDALADALQQIVLEFDVSDVAVVLFQYRSPTEELDRVKAISDRDTEYGLNADEEEEESRNVSAIGYQIGGITLLGFDYEFRLSNLFGVHGGIGLAGYTAGVKIHTGKKKDSPFFNISMKDGGFGLMRTTAVEYGGRVVGRNTGGFGFHGQVGLSSVLYIDREFEESVFGSDGVAPIILSFGIGVSW